MSFSLLARYKFARVTDISEPFLRKIGVTLLLLDLDNTVAPYGEDAPSAGVLAWADTLRRNGIRLFFVSNSRRSERVSTFADALGAPYILRARKPSPAKLRVAMDETGVAPEHTAIAGDQIFTDTLAGNLACVATLLVEPIKLSPLLKLRYIIEIPFRALSGKGVK